MTYRWLPVSQGDMIHIDFQVLPSHLRHRRDAFWDNVDIAVGPVLLRARAYVHTETGLLGLQAYRPAGRHASHFWTCPFMCAACTASCALGWLATRTWHACSVCQDEAGIV